MTLLDTNTGEAGGGDLARDGRRRGAGTTRKRLVAMYAVALTKIYKLGERPALDNVDVAFGAGELCAIMGPPGAGKTTLLACLAGHEPPSSGRVFMGRAATGPPGVRRNQIGFVLEHTRALGGGTVRESMRWAAALSSIWLDRWRTHQIAAALGLGDRLDTPLHRLTDEQRHLAACATALVALPAVLVVDEPRRPLPAETFDALGRCTADLGCAVLAVASDPAAAARADRVLFISGGRVAGMLTEPTQDRIRRTMDHLGRTAAPVDLGASA